MTAAPRSLPLGLPISGLMWILALCSRYAFLLSIIQFHIIPMMLLFHPQYRHLPKSPVKWLMLMYTLSVYPRKQPDTRRLYLH